MSVDPIRDDLSKAEPDLPDELSDRAQDVWEPLLAIADAAGGDWPTRAREAAKRLSSRRGADEATLGVRLLADLRDVFGDEKEITTAEIRRRLRAIEEAPWGGWNDGEGITARELANKLRPYGIKSGDIHIEASGKRKTVKGYQRADFEDAWGRYVSPPPDSKCAKRANGSSKPETAPPQARQDLDVARIEKGQKPHEQANGADGADRDGGNGRETETEDPFGDIDPDPSAPPPAGDMAGMYGEAIDKPLGDQ